MPWRNYNSTARHQNGITYSDGSTNYPVEPLNVQSYGVDPSPKSDSSWFSGENLRTAADVGNMAIAGFNAWQSYQALKLAEKQREDQIKQWNQQYDAMRTQANNNIDMQQNVLNQRANRADAGRSTSDTQLGKVV
jgi:hypothetical protein